MYTKKDFLQKEDGARQLLAKEKDGLRQVALPKGEKLGSCHANALTFPVCGLLFSAD